jgi:hypothetical protein
MYGTMAMTGMGYPAMLGAYGASPYYYGGGFNRFRYGVGANYGLGGGLGMGMGYGGAAWMNPMYMSGSYW